MDSADGDKPTGGEESDPKVVKMEPGLHKY